jgi:hypothetical protein
MYLHKFPLYFCFNLRRFILRWKSQEPNPGVNRVLPVFNSATFSEDLCCDSVLHPGDKA